MSLIKREDVKSIKFSETVLKQVPISAKEGWDGWVMRIFTLKKDGATPFHTHDWPHINYIIKGSGTLFIDGEEKSVSPGDTAYIKGGEKHQFKNKGNDEFSFMCIVPEEGDK